MTQPPDLSTGARSDATADASTAAQEALHAGEGDGPQGEARQEVSHQARQAAQEETRDALHGGAGDALSDVSGEASADRVPAETEAAARLAACAATPAETAAEAVTDAAADAAADAAVQLDRSELVAQVLARFDQIAPQPDWPDTMAVQYRLAQGLAARTRQAQGRAPMVLAQKLMQALDRLQAASTALAPTSPATPRHAATLSLAELNAYIQSTSQASRLAEASDEFEAVHLSQGAEPLPALKSLNRFQDTWALISAEATVDMASFRAPTNAGPLNAHRLVLKTLAELRERSPAYLRHSLAYVDTLMWLDAAYADLQAGASKKSAGKGNSKTAGKTPARKSAGRKR